MVSEAEVGGRYSQEVLKRDGICWDRRIILKTASKRAWHRCQREVATAPDGCLRFGFGRTLVRVQRRVLSRVGLVFNAYHCDIRFGFVHTPVD